MKSLTQPAANLIPQSIFHPAVVVLGILAVIVVAITLSGKQVPLLSNMRASLIILLVLGMAMCAQGGLARVAATQSWAHPLSITGIILGITILVIAGSILLNIKLPFFTSGRQMYQLSAILIGAKVVISLVHTLIGRG